MVRHFDTLASCTWGRSDKNRSLPRSDHAGERDRREGMFRHEGLYPVDALVMACIRARSSVAVIQPAIGPWSHDPDGGDEPLLLLRAHRALCPRRATRRAALRRTGRQ